MSDNNINSQLEYIRYVRKLVSSSVVAGIVIFILYYYSESDLFLFMGLFLLSWATLYGFATLVNLLLLMRSYKMLVKELATTILLIVFGFVMASVLLYYGFNLFLRFSD